MVNLNKGLNTSRSDDDGETDPMVCKPIKPFVISAVVEAREHRECTALIDSGCTRSLMSAAVATSLGVGLKKLSQPICFEQMDSSLLGGQPATHVTEWVILEIGPHQEVIRFMVVPGITEEIVLGLAWMNKWGPTLWWGWGMLTPADRVWAQPPPPPRSTSSPLGLPRTEGVR